MRALELTTRLLKTRPICGECLQGLQKINVSNAPRVKVVTKPSSSDRFNLQYRFASSLTPKSWDVGIAKSLTQSLEFTRTRNRHLAILAGIVGLFSLFIVTDDAKHACKAVARSSRVAYILVQNIWELVFPARHHHPIADLFCSVIERL